MEESKTAYFNESPGETLSSNKPKPKVMRVLNDLLPYQLRPIKAKRRGKPRAIRNLKHEVYYLRMLWASHNKPKLLKRIQLMKKIVWK
jgi:hypothetical protein